MEADLPLSSSSPSVSSTSDLHVSIGDAISRIQFAPKSNHLLVSSWDSLLRLYDVEGSVLRLEALSEGALLDCCFEDESSALSASSDGHVRRYDLHSKTQIIVGKHNDSATCVEYSQETGQIVTAGLDNKLMLWDTHKANGNVGKVEGLQSDIWSMSLCQFYILIAVGKMIITYDLRNLKRAVQTRGSSMSCQIKCVRPFSSYEGYVMGSVDGCVTLKYLNPTKACELGCIFRCHPRLRNGRSYLVSVNDIAFHPCSDTFVTGDYDGYVVFWDAQSRKRLFELPRCPSSVASLSYNHSGQLLAVASSFTHQEATQVTEAPRVFIHAMESLGSSSFRA